MEIAGKKVFVSGGAGVIGQELVSLLEKNGAERFVGDLKPRPAEFGSSVFYRQGDLNTLSRNELDAFAPHIFVHLAAAFERTSENYSFWEENFWNNVRLSHHLMSIAKDLPTLERVVFASSYLIYDPVLYRFPRPQESPIRLSETSVIAPRNLTGSAKLSHEIELEFLNKFKGSSFSYLSTRIFRGYGRGSRDVISRWIRSLLNGDEIYVYGQESIFDYIYATDSARGIFCLMSRLDLQGGEFKTS